MDVRIRVITVQIPSEQTIREERERYDALLARLGPPDRQAATDFLAQRGADSTPEDPAEAELAARFRAKTSLRSPRRVLGAVFPPPFIG